MDTLLVVGLGNPGEQYRNTRHNTGFRLVEMFADKHGIEIDKKKKFSSFIGSKSVLGRKVVLAMPQTYMNESGKAVLGLLTGYRLAPEDILVAFDDADLELGRIQFRLAGGSGGHRGMASIINAIGQGFNRLRIGIGRPGEKPDGGIASFVLGAFSKDDAAVMDTSLQKGVEGIEAYISQGASVAMNHFNRRDKN